MTAFIASMLWHDAVSPSMLLGEVSAHRVSVNSTSAATIQRLTTRRLALVKAGDPIAELSPTDTRASLDLIQSDLIISEYFRRGSHDLCHEVHEVVGEGIVVVENKYA
jgi:multidrug resistance efflux pump